MKNIKKNFFDINTTDMRVEGEEFCSAKVSEDLSARYDKFREQLQGVQDKAAVPCLVLIMKFVLNLVWVCVLGGMLQSCGDGYSWERMYHNAPVLFYVGGEAFALWLIIFIYERYKMSKAMKTVDMEMVKYQADALERQLRMEIGIPEDAGLIDIIYQCYEMKNGKKKILHAMTYPFMNSEVYVYRKGDSLCFCDRSQEYVIGFDRIGEPELFKRAVQVSGWNKDEPIDDKKFKEFKPYQTNAGIFVKQHYILHIRGAQEELVIRVPNYDFATVQKFIVGNV